MAKRPDTPCTSCGKLLWSSPKSAPADRRLCRECRSTGVQPAEPELTSPPWSPPELGLAERGTRLWREVTAEGKLSPLDRVLLEEACRIADRCDQLDDFLRGREDAWMRFHARNDDGTIVRVVVDRALAESREQAATLRMLAADLRASRAKSQTPKQEASALDDLAKRREERRQSAGR